MLNFAEEHVLFYHKKCNPEIQNGSQGILQLSLLKYFLVTKIPLPCHEALKIPHPKKKNHKNIFSHTLCIIMGDYESMAKVTLCFGFSHLYLLQNPKVSLGNLIGYTHVMSEQEPELIVLFCSQSSDALSGWK